MGSANHDCFLPGSPIAYLVTGRGWHISKILRSIILLLRNAMDLFRFHADLATWRRAAKYYGVGVAPAEVERYGANAIRLVICRVRDKIYRLVAV